MRFMLRWLVSAIAVAAAVLLVPGFDVSGNSLIAILVTAVIIGLVNATLGFVFKIGAIGCIVMTLGLFNLVINAGLLWISVWIVNNWLGWLGGRIIVDGGFWPYFWAAIVISIVSGLLNWFVPDEEYRDRR
ncbi:MAG: phage holin family protein [Coriobacteriia bacterium]|jgi:putative membrane protein|nr:phage holin family protein [Coriobacteriia bacterium]